MKLNKRITHALAAAAILSSLIPHPSSLHASVPLRWTVETSRVQPAVFDVVRGETIDLEAAFTSYGKPVATTNQTAFIAWQTNGMDSAWWITNAVTSGTSATARFTPAMDPGAPTVTGFIGLSDATSSSPISHISSPISHPSSLIPHPSSLSYRAAFTLRFRKGPGASPNTIEHPPRVLDLARTVVINPPWPTQQDFAATTTVMKAELKGYVDAEIEGAGLVTPQSVTNAAGSVASNVVTKAYVEGLGINAGLTTNDVSGVITNHVTSGYLAPASALSSLVSVGYVDGAMNATIAAAKEYADENYQPKGSYATSASISNDFPIVTNAYTRGDANTLFRTKTEYEIVFEAASGGNQKTINSIVEDVNGTIKSVRWSSIDAYSRTASDARYAPTSTAVTVASHTSQLSQLSQSVGTVQSSISTLNNGYTRLYNFSTGATNANFSATNYPPTAAAAATRCHYQPEQGMDFSTVPASLQLNEYRDGAWRTVMDTRDWTVWYYRFKEIQLTNEIARLKAQNAVISNNLEIAKGWANHTANGVENPMTDTLVVDRPNMWLMADYEWQKCVSGSNQCFVLRAKNVALSGGANTNGFLEICDAFGKPYMRINKSSETFAEPVFSNITYSVEEGAWYVVFGNAAKPTTGGANAEIVGNGTGKCILYAEDDPECPATITWPESADSHAGHWIMKAVPKPLGGVVPSKMFFGAEIKVSGKDYVEYVKEASFGAGIRVGNNVYEAVESGNTLIWTKRND